VAIGSSPHEDDNYWKGLLKSEDWQQKLLKDVDITKPPYVDHYPELKGFMEFAGEPRRNHARANLIVKCGAVKSGNWDVTDSFVTDSDPGFVNAAKLNFQLRDDSVAFEKIPGFEKIPFEQIGLQRDEFRRHVVKGAR
jgi:hypothetical protein